jgi:hypothetical protein
MSGKFVINPQYTWAYNFEDGVAQVGVRVGTDKDTPTKYGYIDKQGKYIWQPSN